MKYAKILLSWIFIGVIFITFGPFFIFGYTFGQFIGATYHGYKDGRENMISNIREFFNWVKR